MEGRSASNYRRNGVNPAISAKGTTPDKNRITAVAQHLCAQCDAIVTLTFPLIAIAVTLFNTNYMYGNQNRQCSIEIG